MEKCNIVFLILHYQVINETLNCINSIKKFIDTDSYHIIVVDNNSSNNSGNQLLKMYNNDERITVLLVTENLGFSGGNNVGFEYAKSKFNPEFICMMNNDTEIIQNDFYATIKKEFERSHFSVLGPEIHLKDGSICEYPKTLIKLADIEKDRERVKKLILKNKLFIESIHLFLYKYISKLIRWNEIRHKYREIKKPDPRLENVRIHGCCMIFSSIYINKFDGLEVRTFFYGEEDVLYVRLIRNNLLSVYSPELKIFHCEEAATSAAKGKNYKKRRYMYKTHLNSLNMIEAMYKEDLDSLKDYIF